MMEEEKDSKNIQRSSSDCSLSNEESSFSSSVLSESYDELSSSSSSEELHTLDYGSRKTDVNSEEDYPEGSWLGYENKSGMRVRCPLSLMELAYVNTTCSTPKKMAIALVNRFFSSENKENSIATFHDKQKLNPVLIYGIQCHLISMFGITKEEWKELKCVVDSKYSSLLNRHLEDMLEEAKEKNMKTIENDYGKVKRAGCAQLEFLSKAVVQTENN